MAVRRAPIVALVAVPVMVCLATIPEPVALVAVPVMVCLATLMALVAGRNCGPGGGAGNKMGKTVPLPWLLWLQPAPLPWLQMSRRVRRPATDAQCGLVA